jgi:hypothetical protein
MQRAESEVDSIAPDQKQRLVGPFSVFLGLSLPNRLCSVGRRDQLSHDQQVSCDGDDTMDANRAVARRPGKHKHTIEWH